MASVPWPGDNVIIHMMRGVRPYSLIRSITPYFLSPMISDEIEYVRLVVINQFSTSFTDMVRLTGHLGTFQSYMSFMTVTGPFVYSVSLYHTSASIVTFREQLERLQTSL